MFTRPSEFVRCAEDIVLGTGKLAVRGVTNFVRIAREVAFERAAQVEAWRLRRAQDLLIRASEINSERV